MNKRVIAYIDGFNLYFGLKDAKFRRYYWLNIKKLAKSFICSGYELVYTKYFTTRISQPEDKRKRQAIYIEALETLSDFGIFYGHYLGKDMVCWKCGYKWKSHEEKMTDVNIATEMLKDAFCDNFDTAFLITADSDLTSPIRTIKELFPKKQILVIFPPKRVSHQLKITADIQRTIGRGFLKKSQFPNKVQKHDGFTIKRPKEWQ